MSAASVGFVWSRRRRKGLTLILGLVLFFAAYAWLLDYQEAQVRQRLEELRASDPDRYLAQIRTVVTFDRYIAEYRKLKGYDKFRPEVPPFLLGRWALFPKAKRVSDVYIADDCTNSVAFENGMIVTIGEVGSKHGAEYRLDGSAVTLLLSDVHDVPVWLISYGERLHHIELTLPGYDGKRFGYLCK